MSTHTPIDDWFAAHPEIAAANKQSVQQRDQELAIEDAAEYVETGGIPSPSGHMRLCRAFLALTAKAPIGTKLADAARAFVACVGRAEHLTDDEREGLGYLRAALAEWDAQ